MLELFERSPCVRERVEGEVFDGFFDPVSGRQHHETLLPEEEKTALLMGLGRHYLSLYATAAPDVWEKDIWPKSRNKRRKSISGFLHELQEANWYWGTTKPPVRIVFVDERDRRLIPREFWGTFRFEFVNGKRLRRHPEEFFQGRSRLIAKMAHGVFAIAAAEAQCLARRGDCTPPPHVIYERIIDRAADDASLLLPGVENTVDRLCLKTVAYLLLARGGIRPDEILTVINKTAKSNPGEFFDNSMEFKKQGEHLLSGLRYLLTCGLYNSASLLVEISSGAQSSFSMTQEILEVAQYLEDVRAFAQSCEIPFSRELSFLGCTPVS